MDLDIETPGSPEAPVYVDQQGRWKHLYNVLSKRGPYTDEEWVPGPETIQSLESSKILVIGAGGLGCEILKNLALSGFKDIHVIDMDTIDISNLNRQFLFRQADIGKPKAEVAAAFVQKRVKGVTITPYVGKIQDKDEDYYMQFKIIICGLDSIEARRWINATLISMVDMEDPDSLKPLVDGGTEGFKGQARVILPTLSSCIECQLDMHAPRPAVPLCTIATIPRQPQHCIEWAHQIAWQEKRKDDTFDSDDMEHISWIYNAAYERAQQFHIHGVTFQMTQGVVKNIIPAIASTNAVIAASTTSEVLKIASSSNPYLDNYMMYAGEEGVYTYTFEAEKKPDCPVCGNLARKMNVDPNMTLGEFIESLGERAESQLKKPSMRTEEKTLYQRFPPQLEEMTRPHLKLKLSELIEDGQEIAVSDPAYTIDFRFRLNFN
ncbi:Molybdenum cofactor biosynthesis MoeB [Penicillium brevicompactum]|uniref:NEDD8-activating enzyme E1 catalytic subunit n=1 Tax=Penicillium brevicompactum TaxID=5074 RepID=A0A9W9QA24_PENBR|nr:Molybdenum cofactor biosynthesis MoeB [Penicillium brevicompactum]KAJ5329909.1 Molybdenum cofactor biosynthesis MoeB [Penicillium brevicompactum]KAJ5344100.1 Molybdenum cofactor biosynthesis MoeB [Penicillium brevicompactum]KAJ5354648.1 Molybdenum cofactor biosynthesis MoeB [Penicillium brevicompactum]